MAIQEAEESEPEDEDSYQQMAEEAQQKTPWTYLHRSIHVPNEKKVVKWIGDPLVDDGQKVYFRLVQIVMHFINGGLILFVSVTVIDTYMM